MKKKIIACVLACAMLLMGTGYAYWTDLISLTANADTGYLDVKFTDADYVCDFSNYNGNDDDVTFKHVAADADVVDNGDAVTLALTNLYPGYGQKFRIKAENFGTLAAKLGKITSEITTQTGSVDLDKMLGISITATLKNSETETIKYWFFGWHYKTITTTVSDILVDLPSGEQANVFEVGNDVFIRLSNFSEAIAAGSNDDFLFLDTNNTDSELVFDISIAMDPDQAGLYTTGTTRSNNYFGNVDADTQDKSATITLDFLWDQYNVTYAGQ